MKSEKRNMDLLFTLLKALLPTGDIRLHGTKSQMTRDFIESKRNKANCTDKRRNTNCR